MKHTKKIVALTLCLLLFVTVFGCGSDTSSDTTDDGAMRVAMVTDYADIDDHSFNQTTYEAAKAFCDSNNIPFTYYRPAGDTTADRVSMIEKAAADEYNVLILPGFAFSEAIVETAEKYPNVKFVALDVSEKDLSDASDGKDFNRENVYTAVYKEELAGFMAGYAAVYMGYTKLGFLGGMAVPAVIRYGYGFVQGADIAAEELDADVTINYVYGNRFSGDDRITSEMDKWYQNGTEVVFACGGGIYTSAAEAAQKAGAKVIGVDVDQAAVIDEQYGEGITVTSAMKGLGATVKTLLTAIKNGKWYQFQGKTGSLGLVSSADPSSNYVQLPLESTLWNDTFSQDDYKALVKKMANGEILVSDDTSSRKPSANRLEINFEGNIK